MRKLLLLPVLAGLVLVGAACSKSSDDAGVATANGGAAAASPSASAPAGDREEQLRQFAQCMRDAGVDVKDPQPGTAFGGLGGMGDGINPNDPKVQAAFSSCQSKLPNGGQPPKLNPQQVERYRDFAGCMRENGIDLPDPAADGTLQINPSNLGLLQDPNFQKALTACRDKLTGLLPSARPS
jgi:hypothetical protein